METFGGNVWSEICCRNLVGEIGGFFLEEIPYLILDFDDGHFFRTMGW